MCQIPGGRGRKFKLPTLTELHNHLFGVDFGDAHNATADVEATTRCFLELIRLREFTKEELDADEDYFRSFLRSQSKTYSSNWFKTHQLSKRKVKKLENV